MMQIQVLGVAAVLATMGAIAAGPAQAACQGVACAAMPKQNISLDRNAFKSGPGVGVQGNNQIAVSKNLVGQDGASLKSGKVLSPGNINPGMKLR
ncbi:hypothetical protein OPKNFCMD_1951 [Methylobacterium crusticola]|uniref:Secreted protein n=1 Tax=Methylobacterium crusticola TaxID=1697972 RepID=A0ABQ4QX59_9HYPH|nr:hypothetical protein [Methylobacterium crusticola]GJD49221.1 hypothetical protein OPKNFCMD_1951 [Methylobacterium crusticola]